MKTFLIEKTETTPLVLFDNATKTLNIEGISLPENPYGFYSQIYSFIDDYDNDEIIVNFDLKYANSSSYKSILVLLKKCQEKINTIIVNWYYDSDDEYNDMVDIGKDIEQLLKLKFDFIPKI